jgi:hypothetical protein
MRRSRKTGAPRNPISHLTPEQERALNAHLRLGLPDPDAKRLFAAIDHWLFYGPWSATPEAQEWHADNRARSGRIAQLARALRCELEAEREREGIIVHGLDWPSLGASLERIATTAARLTGTPQAPKPGRRTLTWRENLIALVQAHYPSGKLSRSRGSHFEETIAMVLRFLGESLGDLHGQIIRTLKRRPASPFVLTLHDS